MLRIEDIGAFNQVREVGMGKLVSPIPRIAVGMGTCGRGNGAEGLYHAFADAIERAGEAMYLTTVGCFGACSQEPLVNIRMPAKPLLMLHSVQEHDAERVLQEVLAGNVPAEFGYCKIETWDHITAHINYREGYPDVPTWDQVPFFKGQKKIVLRNAGLINPDDIEEYIGVGGYQALYKVLIDGHPEQVIEQIKASKLRGRGGAGYSTGNKWEFLAKARADAKYVICNADEGDPGAYMNRNEIESDPHALLEGMIIGGYCMGASEGIVYIRAEYPLAVHRLARAIEQAREYGMLGKNIFGRGFNFDIQVVEGAGAFVCGEETALIASLESKAGRPTPRPPFPAQRGLWGKPTNINNVETWYNIAPIVLKGPAWFAETGSAKSAGTKVFSLVGKVQATGLVEMPLGTPLKTFIYDIGEGGIEGRRIKAVQTGGPSGGCIPQAMFDTPVDYETLSQLGSIMGSGGMVVMDEDTCMVDVARYFVEFTHSESCGKCVPCRVGLDKALRILNSFTKGSSSLEQLALLDELARMVRDCSLCGLGQSAPNAVLTTMRHFRHEFEDHIVARRCEAGVCAELALSPCENSCPLHMNVPRFMQLFKEDRIAEAFLSILLDNPLPASTGRVCHHPCETRCRRSTLDEAVSIREVHRVLADAMLLSDRYEETVRLLTARRLESTGKHVAVVGAGPAGLAAAFYLALLGHAVTVLEANSEAGGMLRYGIPSYHLPKEVVQREIALIESLGVNFLLQTRVGCDVSLDELDQRFDSVFVSIGTWRDVPLPIPGIELNGVHTGLAFLTAVAAGTPPVLGRNVVIIGGGNVAMDVARTAVRLLYREYAAASASHVSKTRWSEAGEVHVACLEQRDEMPAHPSEIESALAEGIILNPGRGPKRILGRDGHVTGLETLDTKWVFDSNRRFNPAFHENTERVLPCDSVILAIGEKFDADFVTASQFIGSPQGAIEVDRFTLETSRPHFYAGGDAVVGPSNVSRAMGFGKQAARIIDERLVGAGRWEKLFPDFEYDQDPPDQPSESHRHAGGVLPVIERIRTGDEVALGLAPEDSREEACRCLRCDTKVSDSA